MCLRPSSRICISMCARLNWRICLQNVLLLRLLFCRRASGPGCPRQPMQPPLLPLRWKMGFVVWIFCWVILDFMGSSRDLVQASGPCTSITTLTCHKFCLTSLLPSSLENIGVLLSIHHPDSLLLSKGSSSHLGMDDIFNMDQTVPVRFYAPSSRTVPSSSVSIFVQNLVVHSSSRCRTTHAQYSKCQPHFHNLEELARSPRLRFAPPGASADQLIQSPARL